MSEEQKLEATLTEETEESDQVSEKNEETSEMTEQTVDLAILKKMVEAGLFYGKSKQKTHPKMKSSILTTRNGVEIIDLVKTMPKLQEAAEFIKNLVKDKPTAKILVVGTQPGISEVAKDLAGTMEWPHVTNKWVGGTLTNFGVVKKRVDYLKKLKEDEESGKLRKYNKKEMSKLRQEMDKMEWLFGGIRGMNALPEAVIVINPVLHETAVREARRMKIPVIAVVSTDGDPQAVNYPIPANDNAKPAIEYIFSFIKESLKENLQ